MSILGMIQVSHSFQLLLPHAEREFCPESDFPLRELLASHVISRSSHHPTPQPSRCSTCTQTRLWTPRLTAANSDLPPWGAVIMGGNNDNFHRDGCSQEINHLLVAQSGHRHLADLHQPAALPQPCLPGIAVGLYVCYDTLVVDMEAKLS